MRSARGLMTSTPWPERRPLQNEVLLATFFVALFKADRVQQKVDRIMKDARREAPADGYRHLCVTSRGTGGHLVRVWSPGGLGFRKLVVSPM